MRILLSFFAICLALYSNGQHIDFPRGLTPEEAQFLEDNGGLGFNFSERGIETPPDFPAIRTMAEWEEIQVLLVAWTSYPTILKNIIRAAKEECQVVILSENISGTENYLMGNEAGGPLNNMDNVSIIDAEYDSVWLRDYAANTVYGNEVDDLFLVDWIYNRPFRPNDDASPETVADYMGLDLYTTTAAPTDLVNTGGNFMSDGFGTAFASDLILEENEVNNDYGVTAKSEEEIDQIFLEWQGIERYIKMDALPYDIIHHIDMHMKLINEETLLIGSYPEGTADGPQINANIEYVLSNFDSKFGTPFKVVRIPMPDSPSGLWPDDQPSAYYRTFTNSVFVNKTIILPTYREEYDTTAIRIYEELLPGYNIVPIDCDNQPDVIIAAAGAIHCITHSVGVEDPLLISHQELPDTDDEVNPYTVEAYVKHRTGIESATLWFKTDLISNYTSVAMTSIGDDNWAADIPAQSAGTDVYYYVEGEAVSGKVQVRPIVAPEGYFHFRVLGVVGIEDYTSAEFMDVYPNPAGAITVVPMFFNESMTGDLSIYDPMGRRIYSIHSGKFPAGENKFFFDASQFATGAYVIILTTDKIKLSQNLMVK